MSLPNEIKIIDAFSELTIMEKKSSFIAQVYPITIEEDLKAHLTKAKRQYYDASHHCYALRFADGNFRYSDAGEPPGTAGLRILNAIDHFKLANQMVIVSRYFGGIKLGVGLLGKTYYQAAYNVLKESKRVTKQLFQKITISSEFDQISLVHKFLSSDNSVILETEYKENVTLLCLIKSSEFNSISQKLSTFSKNRIHLKAYPEILYK